MSDPTARIRDLALPLIDPDWRLDLEASERVLAAISKITVGSNSISIELKAEAIDQNAAPGLPPAESTSDLIATREIELVR